MPNQLFGVAKSLANRLFPDRNQPAGLEFTIPFNSNAVTSFTYQLQLQNVKLEWVTGAYIDNSANAQPFNMTIGETGQQITVPARNQASIELLGLRGDKLSFAATSTGNVDVKVIFLNYVPSSANSIWSVLDPATVVGTVTVNGTVTALPVVSAYIDRSLTTGALNTPQSLMGANAARRTFNIHNPYANSAKANGGVLTVAFGAGKTYGQAGGFDVAPGGSFPPPGMAVTNQQIFISATDATCVVSAFEI